MTSELVYASAADLAKWIKARQVSPVEVTRTILERIEASQPVLNAFITICSERAMDEARQAEQAIMDDKPLGALHGIPFSVKDLVSTKDVRTTFGSAILKDNTPHADAVVVQRLRQAGGILVGKTTTPEFGMSPMTQAPLFGRTRNPWRADRSSGGSSGGAGAATAAGMAPLAVATDAGGSTRVPAACNGLVGFKQSLGMIPHDWAQDQFGNTSYVTPLTRTVYDTAMMLDVMAGPDERDPNTTNRPKPDFLAAVTDPSDLKDVRIGWRERLGNEVVAADVLKALADAVAAFGEAGATVIPAEHPFENVEPLWFTVITASGYAQYGKYLEKYRGIMCPTFVRQIDQAAHYTAEELYRGLLMRTTVYRSVQSWFDDVDIVIMPTLSRAALPIDHDHFANIEIDGQQVDTCRRAWYPYTLPFNLTGHPAVSLPCGWDSDGLPMGLQLVARPGQDAFLLRVAAIFEKTRPWAHRRPNLPELDA